MIKLVDRQSVFKKYNRIAEEISEMQRLFFDNDPECFESEDDWTQYQHLFDAKDLFVEKIQKFYSVISFEHEDIETFTNVLSLKLLALLAELGTKGLVMIAHYKMPFVGNITNDYRPLQAAFKKFKNVTKNIKYEEAFEFSLENLAEFIEIAFWIELCDATAPEFVFFHDQAERFAFYLCKEGNVHLVEFDKELISEEILKRYNLDFVQGRCYNKFSNTSKIEGRKSKR